MAILLTPPESVLALVKECVENKVKGAVVFASGFGELGAEGKDLEKEIGRIGREGGTRIVGPNCLGFFNPARGVVTYPQVLMKGVPMEAGSMGGFSQSGSFVDYLVWFLSTKGLRFSSVVSCGNECDLAAEDYLEYLGQDEQDQDHRGLHGGRQGWAPILRGSPGSRREEAHHPVEGRHERAGRPGGRLAHRGAGRVGRIWHAMFKQTGIVNVQQRAKRLSTAPWLSTTCPCPKATASPSSAAKAGRVSAPPTTATPWDWKCLASPRRPSRA